MPRRLSLMFGSTASWLFTLGIIATGMRAVLFLAALTRSLKERGGFAASAVSMSKSSRSHDAFLF
jgi:hypothetical protein